MSESQNLWTNSGYSVNNPSAWAPPILPPTTSHRYEQQTRSNKRPISESEDCDDVFSEESSKDRCSSPNEDCQMGFNRKKRRGIIEKRRRDRINSSLSELRRLVPTAFEKQGSAKLEKAEILQMTVDHLKTLHAKGIDALAYDPHKFAMDYHSIGFRECAAEVARYLVTVEGMDIQDPLRLRLMSHLQCFAAQRELATKQASTPWNYNSYGSLHEYPTNTYEVTSTSQHHPAGISTGHISSTSHLPQQPTVNRLQNSIQPTDTRLTTQPNDVRLHQGDSLSPNRHIQHAESPRHLQNGVQSPSLSGYPSHHPYQGGFTQQGYNGSGQGMKPYRPWGAEVAY